MSSSADEKVTTLTEVTVDLGVAAVTAGASKAGSIIEVGISSIQATTKAGSAIGSFRRTHKGR